VLLDAAGQPLRAAKLWNDTTGAPNLAPGWPNESVRRRWSSDRVTADGGLHDRQARLGRRTRTSAARQGGHVLFAHDYLTLLADRARVTDRYRRIGTGYFDANCARMDYGRI